MHNNYYFLKQLTASLQKKLVGFSLVSCFSQNKEELILEFNNEKESFFIKAHLLSSFSCLTFPSHFSRAKKNSIDLFDEVILKKLNGITQYENERSFALDFDNGYSLVFKMHANRSNVLLSKEGKVIEIFRNQFKADLELSLQELHRAIDWSYAHFTQNIGNLKQTYFTFGKEIWRYLEENGCDENDTTKTWKMIQEVILLLETPTFYILNRKGQIKFSLLPDGDIIKSLSDPIEAINEFFYLATSTDTLQREKAAIQKKLMAIIDSSEGYISKNLKKLDEITIDTPYKIWADVLMANMHQVEKGKKKITLFDFDGKEITLKLKPDLNAQQNAQIFYRKAKNQEIEINKLSESIQQKQSELDAAKVQLTQLDAIATLTDFKQQFKESKIKVSKKEEPLPFHQMEYMGYKIWIGKNAVNNDLLTLKYAHKDDLWLHAKDVAGSHVVIKNQSGKTIPKEVIERAAELAAYNSKRKTESLCPVAYTQKKFVRKRKGDLPGTVVVEREQVIMVTPKL